MMTNRVGRRQCHEYNAANRRTGQQPCICWFACVYVWISAIHIIGKLTLLEHRPQPRVPRPRYCVYHGHHQGQDTHQSHPWALEGVSTSGARLFVSPF